MDSNIDIALKVLLYKIYNVKKKRKYHSAIFNVESWSHACVGRNVRICEIRGCDLWIHCADELYGSFVRKIRGNGWNVRIRERKEIGSLADDRDVVVEEGNVGEGGVLHGINCDGNFETIWDSKIL